MVLLVWPYSTNKITLLQKLGLTNFVLQYELLPA